MPRNNVVEAAPRSSGDSAVAFIKWYSRIALAIGLAFTMAAIYFMHASAGASLAGTSMTFEGVAAALTVLISRCLLVQALVVTFKFAARVRVSCAAGGAPRREVRWHLAALALITIGCFVPTMFR